MSVRKLHNSWWVDFRFGRVRYRKRSPENSKAGAKAYEAVLRQKLALGEQVDRPRAAPVEKAESTRFDLFADEWLSTYVLPNNKPATILGRRQMLRAHLVPWFRSRSLDKIGPLDLERYKADKLASGLMASTVNGHLGTLRKLLQTAVDWGRLGAAPKVKKLREPPPGFAFLSPEECRQLLSNDFDRLAHAMVLVALRTGLRYGELAALDWTDIDLERRLLTVRHGLSVSVLCSPKNNKVRHVPLTEDLCRTLADRRQPRGFLFSVRGARPITHGAAMDRLRGLCDRVGLRRIGWHVLRHTFCSQLVQRGVPLPAVQALLGHADLRMTLRYSHLAPSALREAVSVLDPHSEAVGHSAVNTREPALAIADETTTDFRSTTPILEAATFAATA